jgi:ligand-binding SRPBCC domain-containing protein
MTRIERSTRIAAPIDRCFDLSRSIDLQLASTQGTRERAIAGVTSGLIGAGQTVTWEIRILGVRVRHTSVISQFEPPHYFQDRMVAGALKSYCHDHHFEVADGGTLMRDVMVFEAPFGLLGRAAEWLALDRFMQGLLDQRNDFIRAVAELEEWREYLKD